jgi:Bifunctional DNA primase/polymerase, N-terminal
VTAVLDAALAYAAHGWPVFVLSRSKVPVRLCGSDECEQHRGDPVLSEKCSCLTCHGFYAATRNQTRIIEMVRRHPAGCLAVRTGAPSGLVVLDFDIEQWVDDFWPHRDDVAHQTMTKLDEANVLPGTVTQVSGSGGLHMLYRHPGGYIKSGPQLVGPKVDSKADGGYFIVAPSIHPATRRRYRWPGNGRWDYELPVLHEALAKRLRRPEPSPRQPLPLDPFARSSTMRGRLGGLLTAILETPPNTKRNDMLFWASRKAGEMIAAGDIDETMVVAALQKAGIASGLTASEIGNATRGTIGSGLRKGLRQVVA